LAGAVPKSGVRSQELKSVPVLHSAGFGSQSLHVFSLVFVVSTFCRSFVFINFSGYPRKGRNRETGVRSQELESGS
jgi:hypothetical protein